MDLMDETEMEIWKILEKYQLDFESKITNMFCLICKRIFIDPHKGPCGCNYCKRCIISFLNETEQKCPGRGSCCKKSNLFFGKNVVRNYEVIERMSQLKVKCPMEGCGYKCNLFRLNLHLKFCKQISVECPFKDIGCNRDTNGEHLLSDHLISEMYSHSKLLMNWIFDMKKEKTSFIENMDNEMINLKQLIQTKLFEAFAKIEEYKLLYEENYEILEQEMKMILKQNKDLIEASNALKQMNSSQNIQAKKNILKLKKEISDQKKEIHRMKNVNEYLERKLDDLRGLGSRNRSLSSSASPVSIEVFAKEDLSPVETLNPLSHKNDGDLFNQAISVKYIASLSWTIINIKKGKENGNFIKSDDFFSVDNRYKMWLLIIVDGCFDHKGSHICIGFWIDNNNTHEVASLWPLECVVRMRMINRNTPSNCIILEKRCKFSKFVWFSTRESFHFQNSNINRMNLIQKDSIFIKCNVEAKCKDEQNS